MEVIPFCRRSGISYVAYSSLAQGILTGKFTENPQFHHRDHRQHTVLFAKEVWPHVYGCVEELKRLAKRIDRPLLDVALHWLLERPEVTTILAGARSVKQIRSVCNALDDDIDTAVLEECTSIARKIESHLPDTDNIFGWYP